MSRWENRRIGIDTILDAGWSRELAWILGMTYGDGHVAQYEVSLSGGGTSDAEAAAGKQLMERWVSLVDPNREVTPNRESRHSFRVGAYSKRFCDFCRSFGLESNKSKILCWPTGLPEIFAPDFVRGLWDADGSVASKHRLGRESVHLEVSCFLAAKDFVTSWPTYLPGVSASAIKTTTKGEGHAYAGNQYFGVEFVGAKALCLADWMYATAVPSMRHELKWAAYRQYKDYVSAGCVDCGKPVYKLGRCRECYSKYKFPVQARDQLCTTCGKHPQLARGLCNNCYGKEWEQRALNKGLVCSECKSKPVPYAGLCAGCESKKRKERVAKGEYGMCPCGQGPISSVSRGICRKCDDRRRYREKTQGVESPKLRAWSEVDCSIREVLSQNLAPADLIPKLVAAYRGASYPWLTSGEVDVARELDRLVSDPLVQDGVLRSRNTAGQKVCLLAQQHNLAKAANRGRGVSLEEAYHSEIFLRKAITILVNQGREVSARSVTKALRYILHSPSNFPPALARWLVDQYCRFGGTVLDPCIGYGGRLLGALASTRGVYYVGRDVSSEAVFGAKRLVDVISPYITDAASRVILSLGKSEDWSDWPSADLVLSSPPYYDAEIYREEERASSAYASYISWRDQFLAAVLRKAADSIVPGGHLVLVVSDTQRSKLQYPVEADCRMLAEGFGLSPLEDLGISYRPGKEEEPEDRLLVWQKPKPAR